MYKNIVFDMGNVIMRFDSRYIMARCVEDVEIASLLHKEVFDSGLWYLCDEGTLNSQDLLYKMQEKLPVSYHKHIEQFIHHWYEYCPPIIETLALIKELKLKGYQLYLLSNTSTDFDLYKNRFEAFAYLNDFYISAKHKKSKPNLEIYLDFLKQFDLEAEQCFFIDDIEANIIGAKKANIDGIVFKENYNEIKEKIYHQSYSIGV